MQLTDQIQQINNKLQQLLKQYEHLVKENRSQRETISRLQEDHQLAKDKLDGCLQENLILKASVSSMEPQDKKELEQKISQYVKSIDQCISLLSR